MAAAKTILTVACGIPTAGDDMNDELMAAATSLLTLYQDLALAGQLVSMAIE